MRFKISFILIFLFLAVNSLVLSMAREPINGSLVRKPVAQYLKDVGNLSKENQELREINRELEKELIILLRDFSALSEAFKVEKNGCRKLIEENNYLALQVSSLEFRLRQQQNVIILPQLVRPPATYSQQKGCCVAASNGSYRQ